MNPEEPILRHLVFYQLAEIRHFEISGGSVALSVGRISISKVLKGGLVACPTMRKDAVRRDLFSKEFFQS